VRVPDVLNEIVDALRDRKGLPGLAADELRPARRVPVRRLRSSAATAWSSRRLM
jgi:hypothetical protein